MDHHKENNIHEEWFEKYSIFLQNGLDSSCVGHEVGTFIKKQYHLLLTRKIISAAQSLELPPFSFFSVDTKLAHLYKKWFR